MRAGWWRLLLWPGVLAFICAVSVLCRWVGFDPIVAYGVTVTVSQCVLLALERVVPLREDWCGSDHQRSHDLGHYVASMALGNVTATWLISALAWPLHDRIVRAFGASPWPTSWPFALQLVAALLVAELGLYWQHRLMHVSAFLWRLHAVHHECTRLNVLKATRQHAVDLASATLAALFPLVVLGAPASVVGGIGALSAALGLLQHANVAMVTPTWLDAWVCTPADHMLHHSRDLREGNTNFGVFFVVYDRLFGTFEVPRASTPREVGLHDEPKQRSFAAELLGR